MSWVLFAFLSAFFGSTIPAFSKRGAQRVDLLSAVWAQRFFSLFIILPVVLFTNSFVPLNKMFWLALIATVSLNTITSILLVKAIKDSPLSLILPITSFTSVFLLITSPFMVGEYPSFWGAVGVLLVAGGFYALNINNRKHGFWEPMKAAYKQEGPRLMFIVALIWGVTSNLDKIAVKNSNPLLFSFLTTAGLTCTLSIILIAKKTSIQNVLKNSTILTPIGVSNGLSNMFQMMAISVGLVPYVHAIKDTGIIFASVWGYLFFKETNIKERLFGTLIMIVGVIVITLN